MEDNWTYTLFHGTNHINQKEILTHQKYKSSNRDNEWAGTGIYFFWDSRNDTVAANNAYKWAKYIKRFDDPAIVCNSVTINDDNSVLDLRDSDVQDCFHRFREKLFTDARKRAERQGKMISGIYSNPQKLDCLTINQIAKETSVDLVIRSVFINFSKNKYGFEYSSSGIPNCTIVCLRNQDLIKDWREYCVRYT